MKTPWVIGCLVTVSLFLPLGAATRITTIGSHPFFSVQTFPQDMLEWEGNFVYYYPYYQKSPWWGDIDQPENKPDGTNYTTTGTSVVETDGSFEHSGSIHSMTNFVGYVHRLRDNLVSNLNVDYSVDAMRNYAEGDMTGDGYSGTIPFDYSLWHALNRFRAEGMIASQFRDNPFGLRLNLGVENTLFMSQHFDYSKNGNDYSTDRALWGWSTRGCNHIFGPRGTQGDAWLQSSYARGPVFRADLQGGITLPKVKIGTLYSHRAGHQAQYSWRADSTVSTGDAVLDRNFSGSYEKSPWTRKSNAALALMYGNVNWRRGERYALNTFFSLGYKGTTAGDALAENLDVENDSREKLRGVTVECMPNVSIYLGKYLNYVDAGLIMEYSYSRLSNTYERWVGGGTTETYWNSTVYEGDENAWENFSYANENYFDLGADVGTMFPLLSDGGRSLHLGFVLFVNSRLTWQTKYYGTNADNGSAVTFSVNNRRENYKREVWFNTMLMLQYMRGLYQFRFELTEPLLYSLLPRTRVTDAGGDNTLFEHVRSPLWLSQQGLRIGVYVSRSMTLPFMRRFQ